MKINSTYSHYCSKNTEIRKSILDVLESISSSLQRAATMLPARVLGTECFSEVLRFADFILTEKEEEHKYFFQFFKEMNTNYILIIFTTIPVQVCKEHRKHKEPPSSTGTS